VVHSGYERHVRARMSAFGAGLAGCRTLTALVFKWQPVDSEIVEDCLALVR
jgi:hypothetical protein